MLKYHEMKKRIEALRNGWDKEADDILRELCKHCSGILITIYFYTNKNGSIQITSAERIGDICQVFSLHPKAEQDEWMKKFKEALLWLNDYLDKGQRKRMIAELETQVYSTERQIKQLRGK